LDYVRKKLVKFGAKLCKVLKLGYFKNGADETWKLRNVMLEEDEDQLGQSSGK